jgi:leucyl/phenylalanyl-tRNA---protein transferase
MNILPELSKYSYTFPNPNNSTEEGIVAYGGDLNPNRVLGGYRKGIFPWYNEDEGDPILWWSPDPRFVLDLDEFHISKSLNKTIKKNIFEIKFDTNFTQVMIECANAYRKDQAGTWIGPEMIESYSKIHSLGFAHSFEAYYNKELVGGGYGIALGNIFCGESMFAKKSDASKVAFAALVNRLKQNGFKYIDSQIHTSHLEKFGAKNITKNKYLELVQKSLEIFNEF